MAPMQEATQEEAKDESSQQYYAKGSVELAVETPVMMQRLEKRRALAGTAERLLIVLCGLPARGKSFVARKLLNYLTWRGNQCRIFNVGRYRRQVASQQEDDACDANFFDDSNQEAARIREEAAKLALKDTLDWLEDNDNQTNPATAASMADSAASLETSNSGDSFYYGHVSHTSRRQTQRIAIFDATNSTKQRRDWILSQCDKAAEVSGKQTGVVFVESICDDLELLNENFRVKISTCPDFANMSQEDALQDLQERVQKYESRYEPLDVSGPHSYIKIFNLSSRLMVNHVYGRLAKVVVPALMSFNTGCQPIFLCRAGETKAMRSYIEQQEEAGGGPFLPRMDSFAVGLDKMLDSSSAGGGGGKKKRLKGDRLGEGGLRFRDALCDFIGDEGMKFLERKKKSEHEVSTTGTSISGLRQRAPNSFSCLVMSSTMPRALETAAWEKLPFPVKDVSNLNPLDMGDFTGMDLEGIKEEHPEWYKHLEREPFHTRFPGGESYGDLINRLESVVIDMEQHLGPTVVVSHVSVLQVLVSYFRSTPVTECTGIEIPMHTVLKFVPLRGGGWLESHHKLVADGAELPPSRAQQPIWGDSSSCLPTRLGSSPGNLVD